MSRDIRPDEGLDGLVTGMNLDTDRIVAEIDFVARPLWPRMMA